MASKKDTIATLLESNRYNIETIEKLEDYLNDQIDRKLSYDLDANLALLKLYQFYPEKLQKQSISKILGKALMNLPNNDFVLAMYLIPEQLVCYFF
jgi:translation initiation factor 3 subunit K